MTDDFFLFSPPSFNFWSFLSLSWKKGRYSGPDASTSYTMAYARPLPLPHRREKKHQILNLTSRDLLRFFMLRADPLHRLTSGRRSCGSVGCPSSCLLFLRGIPSLHKAQELNEMSSTGSLPRPPPKPMNAGKTLLSLDFKWVQCHGRRAREREAETEKTERKGKKKP